MSLIEFKELNETTFTNESGQVIRNVKIVDFNCTKIGQGTYLNNEKHGNWVEIEMNKQNCQIKSVGNYSNGKRYGLWEFKHNDQRFGIKEYDSNGNEIKNAFSYLVVYNPVQSQVLKKQYQLYKNKKIGQCYTFFKNEFLESGLYDINENKVGFWKEMIPDTLRIDAINYDEIDSTIDVVYTEGDYKNGKKQGRWESRAYQNTGSYIKDSIRTVAFGNYEQGLRTGIWQEPYSYYDEYGLKEIIGGNYVNDKRHGKWEFISTIAPKEWGGVYENGMKTGQWHEFQRFSEYKSTSTFDIIIQEQGNYMNNNRVGIWRQKVSIIENFEQLLQYNNDGQLHGEQAILNCIGKYKRYLIKEEGSCQNGQKINSWNSKLFHLETYQWKDYSRGKYNNNGKKVEFWTEYENFDIYDSEGISTVGLENKTIFIKWQGTYDNGVRIGDWTWRFIRLLPERDEDKSIEQVQGSIIYSDDSQTVTGKFILFKAQFGARPARFKYFDVLTGQTVNGLRNGEWKFVYATVQQVESDESAASLIESESEDQNSSNQSKNDNNDDEVPQQSEENEPIIQNDQDAIQQIELILETTPYETYDNGIIIKP